MIGLFDMKNKLNSKFIPNRNHGLAGVVYILENDGLREGWIKIGCSTRSGAIRAKELNANANTGTPGLFRCVFEQKTSDCGLAEEFVFKKLAKFRSGKKGQEYFVLDIESAKTTITHICTSIDVPILGINDLAGKSENLQKYTDQKLAAVANQESQKESSCTTNSPPAKEKITITGTFYTICHNCKSEFTATLQRCSTGAKCPRCFRFNEISKFKKHDIII